MAVYVDALMPCVRSTWWRWPYACHLFADTRAELEEFARDMGLAAEWLQNRPDFPHFDLTRGMRARAIRLGAFEATREQTAAVLRKNREAREAREAAKRQEQPA